MSNVPSSYRNFSTGSVTFDSSGSAIGGSINRPTSFLSSFPSLQNQYGLSFFGTSEHYPNVLNDWTRLERAVSTESPASVSGQFAGAENQSARTGPIDFVTSAAEESSEVSTAVEETEGIAEGAVAESGVGLPVALAAAANQQIGEAYVRAESANTENQINLDYAHNLSQHGLNVGLDASIIHGNQEATRQNIESAGLAGSVFGLPGALIGQALASTVSANPNSSILNTAQSFGGAYNPSDTNAVASASTANLSGQSDMVDNVTN